MPSLAVRTVNSLQQYTQLIAESQKNSSGTLWYRGCGDFTNHKLIPSLYRHPKAKTLEQVAQLEKNLVRRFTQRSLPFGAPRFQDEMETLFVMQHYGTPTRLLDWSENPFMAFFFATTSATLNKQGKPESDAAIWILDPIHWNRTALKQINFTEGVLSVGENDVSGHQWRHAYEKMRKYPVALHGPHNSNRIVAQRGVFALFGQIMDPMEKAYETDDGFPADCLVKIKLPKRHLLAMRKAIVQLGITDSMVFPDLDGLARELRRYFGFEV